jgi:acetyl-CoA carboxylase beta subunit
MSSTKRIELLIDRGTWHPMDEDMIAQDVLKFPSDLEIKSRKFETSYLYG